MKTKTKSPSPTKPQTKDSMGGTYVYDKVLGKVVKVSDRVPKVASKASGGSLSSADDARPCGRPQSQCGGGSCANMD